MAQLQRDAPTGGAAERPAAADPGALLDAVNARNEGLANCPPWRGRRLAVEHQPCDSRSRRKLKCDVT